MSTTIAPNAESRQTAAPRKVRRGWGEILAWSTLAALFVVAVPLFVCMGLWPDVACYGLFAQIMAHGGIVEREIMVFFRPPTMGWILLAIEWLAGGWHSEAIRIADLLFVSAIIALLVHWLKSQGLTRAGRVWTAVVLFTFYFSTSEWCHSQPDTWMLIPSLGALYLRHRQIERLLRPEIHPLSLGSWALLEGFLWGVGCLFKPFVVVPGALCWLLGVGLVYLQSRRWRPLVVDALGMVVGGLLVGAGWMLWLIWGGGWPYFWDDVHNWSGRYYQRAPTFSERIAYLVTHFAPWGLVHLVALPVALAAMARLLLSPTRWRWATASPVALLREALLGACFLGFFLEGNFLQQQYDYHIVPGLLLGIAVIAGQSWIQVSLRRRAGRWRLVVQCPPVAGAYLRPGFVAAVLGVIVTVAVVRHPLHDPNRLALWPRCWQEGGSPELKDRLALDASYYPESQDLAQWRALAQVEEYLRAQGARSGEVTCYGMHTIHLYLDLDITPATRFDFLDVCLWMYPEKHATIRDMLNASKQRYVVSDLHWINTHFGSVTSDELLRDKAFGAQDLAKYRKQKIFPWSEPVVFRAGSYLVHRVEHPVKAFQKMK